MNTIICKFCKKEFKDYPSNNKLYCSKSCYDKSQIGQIPWNKGNFWKKNAAYSTVHNWLRIIFGPANHCDNPNCPKNSKTYDWALKKDCKYKRRRENFIQLCRSCHLNYDMTLKRRAKMKGRHNSPATEFKKGSKWTEEFRKKYMEAMKIRGKVKRNFSDMVKQKMAERVVNYVKTYGPWNKGKKLSAEHKANLSKSHKLRIHLT